MQDSNKSTICPTSIHHHSCMCLSMRISLESPICISVCISVEICLNISLTLPSSFSMETVRLTCFLLLLNAISSSMSRFYLLQDCYSSIISQYRLIGGKLGLVRVRLCWGLIVRFKGWEGGCFMCGDDLLVVYCGWECSVGLLGVLTGF